MLLYCDHCAKINNYPITPKKEKGECQLCNRRLGSMNIMGSEEVDEKCNNISKDIYEMAGVKIRQVEGFVPGTSVDAIEPGMNHKFLTPEKLLFYASDHLVIADAVAGTRFRIDF